LGTNPQMGTVEPLLTHKKFHYRFLVVWSYKIIYRTTSDKVIISRVFHTSRNPKKLRGTWYELFLFFAAARQGEISRSKQLGLRAVRCF